MCVGNVLTISVVTFVTTTENLRIAVIVIGIIVVSLCGHIRSDYEFISVGEQTSSIVSTMFTV